MSHYDIHVGDVIKYPEMVIARTGTELIHFCKRMAHKKGLQGLGF